MEKSRLLYLLQRYSRQKLTAAETQELESWYQQQLDGGSRLFEEPGAMDAQQELLHKIHANLRPEKQTPVIHSKAFQRIGWAAAIILLAVSAKLLLLPGRSNKEQVATSLTVKSLPIAAAPVTIENTTRQTIARYLPDSSFIKLSAGSTLTYAADYGSTTRELQLNGECYFDVRKDTRHPFTVHSAGISTTALGTSFTVSAFHGAPDVKVKLLTGKVVVGNQARAAQQFRQVYLSPGQSFLWNALSNQVTVNKAPDADAKNRYATARKQRLPAVTGFEKNYDRASVLELLNDLATAYQVHINYSAVTLNNMQFSGMVSKTDSLSSVLKRIAILNNMTIEQIAKNKYRVITSNP